MGNSVASRGSKGQDTDEEYLQIPLSALLNDNFVYSLVEKLPKTDQEKELESAADALLDNSPAIKIDYEDMRLKRLMGIFSPCSRATCKCEDFEVCDNTCTIMDSVSVAEINSYMLFLISKTLMTDRAFFLLLLYFSNGNDSMVIRSYQ